MFMSYSMGRHLALTKHQCLTVTNHAKCGRTHILDSFPIVKRQEQDRYDGRYRTRDLVLHFMAAMEAGNPDARIMG